MIWIEALDPFTRLCGPIGDNARVAPVTVGEMASWFVHKLPREDCRRGFVTCYDGLYVRAVRVLALRIGVPYARLSVQYP